MSNNIQTGISRYYGLDGDRIKSEIEKYLINGDVDTVSYFSKQLTSTLEEIEKKVIDKGGNVKYCAGDNILFSGDFSLSSCEELLDLFYSRTNCTASVGIGDTSTEVFLALKLAKSNGGGKIISYQNGQPLPTIVKNIEQGQLPDLGRTETQEDGLAVDDIESRVSMKSA